MTIPEARGHSTPDTGSLGGTGSTGGIDSPSVRVIAVGSLAERPDDDFLTLSEVAATLRTPVNTLRWWRQQGTGPRFFKIGRKLVTTVADLKTWIADQKRAPGPGPDAA